MRSCELIFLTVRIREFRARLPFLRVQILAVGFLLGTAVIDRHLNAILSELWNVVFYCSPSRRDRSMLPCQGENIAYFQVRRTSPTNPDNASSHRSATVSSRNASKMSYGGLCSVYNTPRLARKHLTLMTNGILDTFSHRPFDVLLSSFSARRFHLLRNIESVHLLKARERIFTEDLKPRLLQSKKGEGLAKFLGSSEEEDSQQPNANQKQG